jgi:hypothetical protein
MILLRLCERRRLPFPPCEGGLGGVGRRTSASSVHSPFARSDVRRRYALRAGEAAHTRGPHRLISPSTAASCIRRSPAHPPRPPLHKGGKKEATRAVFAERLRKECSSTATPALHHPGRVPDARAGRGVLRWCRRALSAGGIGRVGSGSSAAAGVFAGIHIPRRHSLGWFRSAPWWSVAARRSRAQPARPCRPGPATKAREPRPK